MFGKKKTTPEIDKEQLKLIKTAQKRIKQKKRLYVHFVLFLIGCLFLILANTVLGIAENYTIFGVNWFVFAILIWAFFFVYHLFTVFVSNRFMGKAWEERQLTKLVAKQKERIEKLKLKLPKDDTLITKAIPASTNYSGPIHKNLTIIAAAGENNVIGKNNNLIWHLGDDLKRFKQLTTGHHIIMGRKTFESFPKPLPNRTHVVITKQKDYKAPAGVIIVNSLKDAIDASAKDPAPFIIGGGEIYRQAIHLAGKIELTRVHETFVGDAFFPTIDPNIWKETANTFHTKDQNDDYDFSFITYERN